MSTNPQHMAALNYGNKLRLERTKIKRELRSLPRGEAFAIVADIVQHPPPCCARATAFELLMAVKLMGRFYTLIWLRKAGVQESRRLEDLTERQRVALAGLLRESDGRLAAA